MINELLESIKRNRKIIAFAVIILAIPGIVVVSAYLAFSHSPVSPAPTPTPLPTVTPAPASTPTPTPQPTAMPTPTPMPTVTPDLSLQSSITPLDQYAPNYMVNVQQSMTMGTLSVDLANSDLGGQYAYHNDTYVAHIMLSDISNMSIDRIKIHATCKNYSDGNYTVYDNERIDMVLLNQSDKISRTVGFDVSPDTPPGKYMFHVDVYTDPYGNNSWSVYGCGFETGLNILRSPA